MGTRPGRAVVFMDYSGIHLIHDRLGSNLDSELITIA
jgi:hypothetical protein